MNRDQALPIIDIDGYPTHVIAYMRERGGHVYPLTAMDAHALCESLRVRNQVRSLVVEQVIRHTSIGDTNE